MNDAADELESETQLPSDWDVDEPSSFSPTETCLDVELDGMFSTLKD